MKHWVIISNYYTGEPTNQLVCGECFKDKFQWHEGEPVQDPRAHYSDKCSLCEKNCGDYFNHFQKAA